MRIIDSHTRLSTPSFNKPTEESTMQQLNTSLLKSTMTTAAIAAAALLVATELSVAGVTSCDGDDCAQPPVAPVPPPPMTCEQCLQSQPSAPIVTPGCTPLSGTNTISGTEIGVYDPPYLTPACRIIVYDTYEIATLVKSRCAGTYSGSNCVASFQVLPSGIASLGHGTSYCTWYGSVHEGYAGISNIVCGHKP
jgi:hypothetical protein